MATGKDEPVTSGKKMITTDSLSGTPVATGELAPSTIPTVALGLEDEAALKRPYVATVSGSRKLVKQTLEGLIKGAKGLKSKNKEDKTGEIAAEGLEGVVKMVENFSAGPKDRLEVSYRMDLGGGSSETKIKVVEASDLHSKFASVEEYEEYQAAQAESQAKEDEASEPKAGSGKKKWQEEQKALAEAAKEE